MVLGKACNCKICFNYPAEVIGLREAPPRAGSCSSGTGATEARGCAGAELPAPLSEVGRTLWAAPAAAPHPVLWITQKRPKDFANNKN